LNSTLSDNYINIKDIFNSQYNYPKLDSVRSEICKCLICNLNQAAITLTNHLIESSLKMCLAIRYSIENKNTEAQMEDLFKSGIEKYDKLDLDDNINRACRQALITKEQKIQLKQFKDDFRNPYSHASSVGILKDRMIKGKIISLNKGENPEKLLEKIFEDREEKVMFAKDVLPAHGILQTILAKQSSLDYFKQTDIIIRDMLTKIRPTPHN
jgi:hypothetical protein